MGKGALKFGGRSGYLPKPRPIFKTSIFPPKNEKSSNTGYAEGVKEPRGSTREQIMPKFIPLDQRIELTAALPKKQYTVEEFAKLPIEQQIRLQNSDLRRQYLRESYVKEAKRLEVEQAKEKEREIVKARLEEEKLVNNNETEAFKLTIPSIEQYLKGPIMRHRTPEENALLEQKRKANRMNNELKHKTKKATALLELYNSASSFITTEEQLNKAIIETFDLPTSQLKNSDSFLSLDEALTKNLDGLIRSTLLGNTENNGPGLKEVEGVLSGENDELLELAHKNAELAKLKTAEDIEKAQKDLLDTL